MTVWTGFAWRMYRTGISVSPQAVRVVHPWRSRIIGSDVADGTEVETPVQQRARMLAFGHRKDIGSVLTVREFAATLSFLRKMHREAVASRPPG